MRFIISHLILTATLMGSLSGCSVMGPVDLPFFAEDDDLATGVRGVQLDEDQIPGYQEVKDQLAAFKLEPTSRSLSAAECACLAASRSQMAALLEKEAANSRHEQRRHRRRGPSDLVPGILREQAAEERNNAAEEALVAYYQLAEIHLQNAILTESYDELKSLRATVSMLRGAGFAMDTDPSELDRSLAELDRQNAELDVNEARLTTHIKTLLNEDPYAPEAIETNFSVEPRPADYELHEAMQIARSNDAQLRSINQFLHHGSTEDLDVARSLLQVASPLLGQAPGRIGCMAKLWMACGHNEKEEVELRLRKQQLRELYQVRQQQLDLEIANGVVTVQQCFLGVGIAKDIFASWDSRVTLLTSQRESQKSEYQELVDAKSKRLKARSDLLHKLIALEVAHAKLRGAMGLLGQECATHGMHGSPTHGSPTHGSPTHGSPTHGSPVHGSPTHGSPTHGSPVHGAPTPDDIIPGHAVPGAPLHEPCGASELETHE